MQPLTDYLRLLIWTTLASLTLVLWMILTLAVSNLRALTALATSGTLMLGTGIGTALTVVFIGLLGVLTRRPDHLCSSLQTFATYANPLLLAIHLIARLRPAKR
jgi:uncharacterized membrane protein YwaF